MGGGREGEGVERAREKEERWRKIKQSVSTLIVDGGVTAAFKKKSDLIFNIRSLTSTLFSVLFIFPEQVCVCEFGCVFLALKSEQLSSLWFKNNPFKT